MVFLFANTLGHQHNDAFVDKVVKDGQHRLGTVTNYSGGVQV
jgi:hypothetical protein